jgi:hypothetical protein
VQLDRLALHLRRRGPWEAIDLGCAMARRWWMPLVKAWLTAYIPTALVLYAIFREQPFIAVVVLWWLKPVFDRVLLEVLSRAVFGEVPAAREAVLALRRSPGVLASLTLHRFDLARSFDVSIGHLEKLRGSAARKRAQSLQRRSRSYAVWLTIVCAHLEVIMIAGFFGAIDLFTPPQMDAVYGLKGYFLAEGPPWRHWIDSVVYLLAVTLIEPLYVAAGFALYLNRRTELEAWDVELALRRLAKRAPLREAALAATVVVFAFLVALPQPVEAAEQRDPGAAIREILDTPEFEQYREVTRLRYKGQRKVADTAPAGPLATGNPLAELVRVIMWLAAIALVAALVYLARRYVPRRTRESSSRAPPPDVLFGLEISPASLPNDVANAAMARVDAGDLRGALGLLYRGALSVLVNREGIDFAPGDTEGDCVRRAAAHVARPKSEFLSALVSMWRATAYGRRTPHEDAVRALCVEWSRHFAQADAT